jgi:hypothetical protein
LSFVKDWYNFNWKLSTKQLWKEVSKWEFLLKFERNKYSITWKIQNLQNESSTNFDIILNQNNSSKINIIEPENSEDFQKFVAWLMW